MASDLSELCSICYTDKPKYKCPRCKTQTCSLPCYKKHQQRASCSGKRDPAEYLKKSQLATPSGIDRDYNYLKGVENGIEHAHRDSVDRGIEGSSATKAFKRAVHPDGKLTRYLAANQITVERAPQGMSRQKTNKTRTTKRGHIMWTVEWVDGEGNRELQDHCLESDRIDDIYEHLQTEKRNAEKRQQNNESSSSGSANASKKRKLSHPDPATGVGHQDGAESVHSMTDPAPTSTDKDDAIASTRQAEEEPSEHLPDGNARSDIDSAISSIPTEDANQVVPESKAPTAAEEDTAETTTAYNADTNAKPKRFYFLLKTGTTSSSKVLIPLNGSQSLTQALQNQVVLEYPTIYILSQPPQCLPEGFMLEKQYKKIRKEEERELDEALRKAGRSGVTQQVAKPDESRGTGAVDANKILGMLRRHVTR